MKLLRKPLVHLLLISILGVISYSNTFNVPFVFDDPQNIVENNLIKDLSNIPSIIMGARTSFASRPLLQVTLALNYYFGGLDTTGYHIVNLLLHLINCVLLYWAIVMIGRFMKYPEDRLIAVAFFSSLIFSVHPLNTDAVTYIVSRSVLLATMFFLLGLMLFHRAITTERRKGVYWVALFVTSILGMASRENFITFPLILFLYDLLFISNMSLRSAAKHYRAYIAVLLSLAYFVRISVVHTYDTATEFSEIGIAPLDYVYTQFNAHWTYLRLLLFPVNQNIDHYYPIAGSLFAMPTVISIMGYAGLLGCAVYFVKKKPIISFSILWFVIVLIPVSFAIALMNLRLGNIIFEHRMYLPSIGLLAATVSGAVILFDRLQSRWSRRVMIVVAIAIPLMLSCAAYARNGVWSSELSLWRDSVSKSPMNAAAHGNLAIAYYRLGLMDLAITHYRVAIVINPSDVRVYNNLALAYERLGRVDMAIEQYKLALKERPHYAKAHYNLGNAYLNSGLVKAAIEQFQITLSTSPNFDEAHYRLGDAYLKEGDVSQARREYEITLQINPDHPDARRRLQETQRLIDESSKLR